jgi:hypothetical protein
MRGGMEATRLLCTGLHQKGAGMIEKENDF